jgi:hypothetical protein
MTRRKFQYNFNNSKNSSSFDYTQEGELMRRHVSKAFYQNEKLEGFLNQMSILFSNLINNVKRIRRHYMYSVDRDDMNID